MTIGNGAVQSVVAPGEPFTQSPDMFFDMTRKNEQLFETMVMPTPGNSWSRQLPQVGIISRLKFTFVGQVVIAAGGATTSNRWPYGLLDKFNLGLNGQNNLWSCTGEDLHVLRTLRFPAYTERVDVFPGTLGGGNALAANTYPLHLTWEVPVAVDDTSLVGSLYAQSGATNIAIDRAVASLAALFSANPGNATLTGTFFSEVTRFSIPRGADGALVVPDLTRLHSFTTSELDFSATGDIRLPMVRSAGQLHRLLVDVSKSPGNRLSAHPATAAASKIDAFRIEYGAQDQPVNFSPASSLLARNNDHYGTTLPYDRLCWDLVRENARRDVLLLQGVTELVAIPTVNSAAVIAGGRARLVQETLF